MGSPDLISICGSAFLGVFIVLSLIALIMRLILKLFPYKEETADQAVIAAISSAYNKVFPDKKIIRIEELS